MVAATKKPGDEPGFSISTVQQPAFAQTPRQSKPAAHCGSILRKISRTAYIHFPHQIRITI
jgi:hypothetical protein